MKSIMRVKKIIPLQILYEEGKLNSYEFYKNGVYVDTYIVTPGEKEQKEKLYGMVAVAKFRPFSCG